ncbi:choice-of-anchor D domain-containing protein [Solirubrobacter taibaiensis]|nr:choice-of-anchor D domain-containing protein [Solirubrobacter taibaiensis]
MRSLVTLVVVLLLCPVASAAAAVAPGWAPTASMLEPRYMHSAVALDDGRVLVAGGAGSNGTVTAELYDPATGTWSPAGSMHEPRFSAAMIKLRDGRVLIAGGSQSTPFALSSAEVYDPATNRWSDVGHMTAPRYLGTPVMLPDGKILVAGGLKAASQALNNGDVFDPTNGRWTATGPFDTAISDSGAALMGDGRVLMAGGWDGNAPRNLARTYLNGSWTLVNPMAVTRSAHRLVTLADGRVLATGGDGVSPTYTRDTAELFDPRTNRWAPTGTMRVARHRPTITPLRTGQVLATGGQFVDPYPGTTSELYDPVRGEWSLAGMLAIPRTYHTATELPDGRVLVTGGQAMGAVAEVWTPITSLTTDPAVGFGDAPPGVAVAGAVQVTNTGALMLLVDEVAIGGAHAADFSVAGSSCRGAIAPGATCVLDVRFAATALGARSATLTFAANTAGGRHAVPLNGRGIPPAAGPGRDSDGDGVPDATDRCAGTRGSAGRSGCPAGLLADPSIAYKRVKGGIRIVAYYVKATTGARLTVKCSKGCKPTATKGKGSRRIKISRLTNRRLTNGTKITVTVAMAGRLTTTVTDRVTKSRRIEGRPRCSPVGC